MAIAMDDYDWYVFSGRRRTSCFATLHVTSTRYDEPVCMEMAEEAELALAIHGCEGETSGVILGGGNEAAVASLKGHLRDAGYTVLDAPDHLQGHNDRNFINRARRRGVQIELTTGLRRELFPGYPKSLQRHPREFQRFIGTMRAWLGSGLS